MRAQLKALEHDMKEFKDINKDYTDQLIRVKVRNPCLFTYSSRF
jgi:DNA repair protein RAD50